MGSFEEAREEEIAQVAYLAGPAGRGYARGLGAGQDEQLSRLKDSVKMRFPRECPDDALDEVGYLYAIERFHGEVNETYRARISVAWETWRWAGTAKAIVDSLHAFGIGDVAAVESHAWGYVYDYSAFVVVLGPAMPYDEQKWGATAWGDATTWGSTATLADIHAVKLQILKWKSDSSLPVKVVLDFGTGLVWGVSRWGENAWGGNSCEWLMANTWEDAAWGEFHWGNGRWIWGPME